MPLYEYDCSACAHRFEVIQKFSDAPIEICPKCGGAVSKLFSSPAIQFKGSGFYLTDYGRGGKSDLGTASAKETKDVAGSGEATTEGKSEVKSEKPQAKTEKSETKADQPTAKTDSKPTSS